MAEFEQISKEGKYKSLISRIKNLTSIETDLIANLSNITSALKYDMFFFG